MTIMERITEIQEEFAQLPETADFDLTLEAINERDVKVTLQRGDKEKLERVIRYDEDLSFISDTFHDSISMGAKGKPFLNKMLSEAYFDEMGYLMVVYEDRLYGATERYKVSSQHREELASRLSHQLGDRFSMAKKPEAPKAEVKKTGLCLYKITYDKDGENHYFIVESTTIEGVRKTALDIIKERGLDIEENNVHSSRIY